MNDNTAPARELYDIIESISEKSKIESTEEVTSERAKAFKNVYLGKKPEAKESVANSIWDERTTLPVDSIRRVARELTKKKIFPKRKILNEERNVLVNKMFQEKLTRVEEKRLEFIRWQLDRIDDAEIGENVDLIERLVIEHEKISKEIDKLLTGLR